MILTNVNDIKLFTFKHKRDQLRYNVLLVIVLLFENHYILLFYIILCYVISDYAKLISKVHFIYINGNFNGN